MNARKWLLCSWACAALLPAQVGRGGTGAEFLKLTGSARSVGLGGGYAALDDMNNMSVNPGLIGQGMQFNMGLNVIAFFQGVTYLGFNANWNTRKVGGIALGLTFLDGGTIPITGNTPDATGQALKQDFALMAGYGHSLGALFGVPVLNSLYVGLDARYYSETFTGASDGYGGMLFDFGVIWQTPLKGLTGALSLINVGLFASEIVRTPLDIKFGARYEFSPLKKNPQALKISALLDVQKTEGMDANIKVGVEAKIIDMIFARLGYRFLHDTGWMAAGLGVRFAQFTFDYSISPYEHLGFDNQFSISYGFDVPPPDLNPKPPPVVAPKEPFPARFDVRLPSPCFSLQDPQALRFDVDVSQEQPARRWEWRLRKGDKTIRTLRGDGNPPGNLAWDGLAEGGQPLSAGAYQYRLLVQFPGRIGDKVAEGTLEVDGANPEVSIGHSPEIFSPDNDGYDDTMDFLPRIKDDCGVKVWALRIEDGKGNLLRQFRGMGAVPERITWDGKGDDGRVVAQAKKYEYRIQVRDGCSNSTEAKGAIRLQTDFYLNQQADGSIMINLEGVEFDTDRYVIRTNSYEILDRAASILLRPYVLDRTVKVEGHTDSQGIHEYNMTLSKNRARAVMEYLINKGVDAARLTYDGYGPTRPVAGNDTVEGRQKNRRSELILRKK